MRHLLLAVAAVLILIASAGGQDDVTGMDQWKWIEFAEKKVTLTINGKDRPAKIKAARLAIDFGAHPLSACLGESLPRFYDDTAIPVLFPEAEFKAHVATSSSGHVHVRTAEEPGKDAALIVADENNSLRFSGDATAGAEIYFVEQARGYSLYAVSPEPNGKQLGRVAFPPNAIRFSVSEPDMPFPDDDLVQATPVSDFDFQMQLHLSESLSEELRGTNGIPAVEVRAGSERLVPRLSATFEGELRTSIVLVLPYPKEDVDELDILVDRFSARIKAPRRLRASVPKEATKKATSISYDSPAGQRAHLAYGLLTSPLQAKTDKGSGKGSWDIAVPSDSYAIIRSRPRGRLRRIVFEEAYSQDVSASFPMTLPRHPMHSILTSEEWKQGFAAIAAPIPMFMIGPAGTLADVSFASPSTPIGDPLSNAFGFVSDLVAAGQIEAMRAQAMHSGTFMLWAPTDGNDWMGPPDEPNEELPEVDVEYVDPDDGELGFEFCYKPDCKCDVAPPKVHPEHEPGKFICKSSWDHSVACPCKGGKKCVRKKRQMKVVTLKITLKGVPYATFSYRPVIVPGFRIDSSFQDLVLEEGTHEVKITVLFKPKEAGVYGPRSVDFLLYKQYVRDPKTNRVEVEPKWVSMKLQGKAVKCGVNWNCVQRGGREGVGPDAGGGQIIVRNGRSKLLKVTNLAAGTISTVGAGATSKTGVPKDISTGAAGLVATEPRVTQEKDGKALIPFLTRTSEPGLSVQGQVGGSVPAVRDNETGDLLTRTITTKTPPVMTGEPGSIGLQDQDGNLYVPDPDGTTYEHYDADDQLIGVSGQYRLPPTVQWVQPVEISEGKIKPFGKQHEVVKGDIAAKFEPKETDWVGRPVTLTVDSTELVRAHYMSRLPKDKDKPLKYQVTVVYETTDKLTFQSTEGLEDVQSQKGGVSDQAEQIPGAVQGTFTIDAKGYNPEKPTRCISKVIWRREHAGEVEMEVLVAKVEEKE